MIRISLSILARIALKHRQSQRRQREPLIAIARAARKSARHECRPLHAAHSWAGNVLHHVDLGHCVADTARGGGDPVGLTSRAIARYW
jgi:hypothetical protein